MAKFPITCNGNSINYFQKGHVFQITIQLHTHVHMNKKLPTDHCPPHYLKYKVKIGRVVKKHKTINYHTKYF